MAARPHGKLGRRVISEALSLSGAALNLGRYGDYYGWLKPFAYLEYCLEQLPNRDLADPTTFASLLPWSDDLPRHLHLHMA